MKRYAVFQYDMGMGGIQKSLYNLLNNLNYSEISIDLYLFSHENFWNSGSLESSLPDGVTVYYLDPGPRYLKYVSFDTALSRLTPSMTAAFPENVYYDCAIDFNSYQPECAAGAILVPSEKRVEWVHNDIEIKLKNEWKYRVLHHFFREKFKFFDEFVCVSQGITEPFRRANGRFLSPDAVIDVIPNCIDTDEIEQKKAEPLTDLTLSEEYCNLVTIGRLCYQKGYDIMLETVKKATEFRKPLREADPETYRDLRLYLIGDGPDREKLEKQASTLGLTEPGKEKVFFLGRRSNPFNIMDRMDAFVSTSRYEGQAMNIMEARAIGLPLYCAKNLEKYVDHLNGYENLAEALSSFTGKTKTPDRLKEYNENIMKAFCAL